MNYFKSKRLSEKFGFMLAGLHLYLVFAVIRIIILGLESDWPMMWLIFFALDFPISLFFFIFGLFSFILPLDAIETAFPDPLGDFDNFILPVVTFGVFGTLWYLFLPYLLVRFVNYWQKRK